MNDLESDQSTNNQTMKYFIDAVGQKIKHLILSNADDRSNISSLTESEVAILEQIIDRLCIRCVNNNTTRREVTPIRHINQVDTWDCGLACIQMVINWLNNNCNATQEEQEEQRRWMMDFVKAKSLWTIDLITLLQNMLDLNSNNNSTYLFCSNRFGIDESYNNLHYYKDAFSEDEIRVKRLFDKAEQQNLPLLQVSHMSFNVLIDLVSRENVVAIVLLDNTIFNQQNNTSNAKTASNIHDQSDLSYSGHYVVLCGVSRDKNDINIATMNSQTDDSETYSYCLVIKNPGIWKETQFVTPSLFEASWRAKGTDEDIILVAKHV
ncbi:guanylate cyclase [Skeletonema marinoi]|uniref:Guanylate cyclase n=1 Tax=Skeletonema marinoi TaxID=267567 RepID=A0A7S2M2U4_9STRA|nr:guanylate cyclase [Skeletonema marinoi]|mmetsp:Transcript_11705/g.20015  ORF Transcript_11705/g.20015 Transcript_11705/m.20015 type:complete len:322 (+) Transcript_11705:129-1094(+)